MALVFAKRRHGSIEGEKNSLRKTTAHPPPRNESSVACNEFWKNVSFLGIFFGPRHNSLRAELYGGVTLPGRLLNHAETSNWRGGISTELDICRLCKGKVFRERQHLPRSLRFELNAGLWIGADDGNVELGKIACGGKSDVVKW